MTIQKRGFNRRSPLFLSGRFAPWLWALCNGVLPLSAFPQSDDELRAQARAQVDEILAQHMRDNPLQAMAAIAKLKYGVSADPTYGSITEGQLTEHAGGECANIGYARWLAKAR